MRFKIRRIDKRDAESIFDLINSDYHNGDCMIIKLSHELESLPESPKYIAIDLPEHMLLFYYENPLK